MSSYQREREDFILRMVKEGMTAENARLILRHANTVQRLATDDCNRGLNASERKRASAAMGRLASIVMDTRGKHLSECGDGPNWRLKLNGDPRGACVKIKVPSGYSNDWGGEGVCVPTRVR